MQQPKIAPWDLLDKKLIWDKLSFIDNKNVLDFGSGNGATANHLAKNNNVTAIEPNTKTINQKFTDNNYTQLSGSLNTLKSLESESFDVILCHCVLEYIDNKLDYINELIRVLKPNGHLSIVKHNRHGRVMQMVVLLNNFDHANELLDGKNGKTAQYEDIKYYDDNVFTSSNKLSLNNKSGIRCFWHMQQNQEMHKDISWQDKILAIEKRVSQILNM